MADSQQDYRKDRKLSDPRRSRRLLVQRLREIDRMSARELAKLRAETELFLKKKSS